MRCRRFFSCCCSHPPVAISAISALTAAAFFCDWPGVGGGAYVVGRDCDVPGSAGMALRSLFAHASPMHWSGNALTTLMVGVPLEGLHGWWRTACIYFGSGLVGVFAFASWRGVGIRYVGASPAVYGLIASFGSHLMLNWAEVPLRIYWLVVLVSYASFDTAYALDSVDDPLNRVAHVSHLGGALGGLFLSLPLLRNQVFLEWEASLVLVGVAAYTFLLWTTLIESTCAWW